MDNYGRLARGAGGIRVGEFNYYKVGLNVLITCDTDADFGFLFNMEYIKGMELTTNDFQHIFTDITLNDGSVKSMAQI